MFVQKYRPIYCQRQRQQLSCEAAPAEQSNNLTRCFDAFDEGLHMSVTFGLVKANVSSGPSPAVRSLHWNSEGLAFRWKANLQGYYS